MTQSPQQPTRLGSLPGEVVLGIARDLQDVTDRIADMKALCDQQMAELADAAAAAAGISGILAGRPAAARPQAEFAALEAELSHLYKTVEAQMGVSQRLSRQFLEIARSVGLEISALRAGQPAPGATAAAGENVVCLPSRREARADAAAQAAADDLRSALRSMQDSTIALFRAQAESRKMVSSLRQRMRDYRRRARET